VEGAAVGGGPAVSDQVFLVVTPATPR
jgi:hypothetical protein